MPPTEEEFTPLLRDDPDVASYGALISVTPKSDFGRTALSQFLMGIVGGLIAVVFLIVSFQVVVSNVPSEQLPFQQAMWGLAAVGGIVMLYGIGSGVMRNAHGLAGVGRWWLLFERGLVILNSGAIEWSGPLDRLLAKSNATIGSTMKLADDSGRNIPLPLRQEEFLIQAILEQARQARQSSGLDTAPAAIPYVLGWAEAKWFGDDRVFRLYPDGDQILVIFAGQFVPEKLGVDDSGNVLPVPGAVGVLGAALMKYTHWRLGKDFDARAQFLDSMSLDQLRAETRNNSASGCVTRDNTTDIWIGPPKESIWNLDYLMDQIAARLKFRVKGKKWELTFFSPEEADFITESLVKIFGDQAVKIDTKG